MKMKMKHFSLVCLFAAMTFGLSSCSNDESDNGTGETQSLVIKLPNNVVLANRSVENQWDDITTGGVRNIRVFLLNDQAVVKTELFDGSEITKKEKMMHLVPANVNYVLLVANYNAANDDAIAALPNITAIKNYFDVAGQNSSSVLLDKTLMGEGTPTDSGTNAEDGHPLKTINIRLNAITARMEVGTVKAGKGIKSVKLVGVWINSFYPYYYAGNANIEFNPSTSDFWKTTPDAGTTDVFADFNSVNLFKAYVPTQYYNENDDRVKLELGGMAYAYHVFEGTNIPHLILLVKGEYEEGYSPGGDDQPFFLKWVTYTKFIDQSGFALDKIEPNKIYKIGVVKSENSLGGNGSGEDGKATEGDTGIEIDAEDLTDKPETPRFDVFIEVTIVDWTSQYVSPSV